MRDRSPGGAASFRSVPSTYRSGGRVHVNLGETNETPAPACVRQRRLRASSNTRLKIRNGSRKRAASAMSQTITVA